MLESKLLFDVTQILSRFATGKLLTERQIGNVTSNVVGKYFADWFPKPKDAIEAEKRVDEAKQHIAEANRLIGTLKADLDSQAEQLQTLSNEIDTKRNLAERYAAIAATNEQAMAAFRAELEEGLRRELTAQANRGKRLRQLVSFTVWLLTLILGAALGAYFPQIVNWLRSIAA